ncbi:nucleoid occlusion protein [Sulfoacidibacillus thermotolerans]|uniref:Nucleoid occlusion protein n=1 Tax=Sulfoacidibacillus thermotolerans TaxID=1765684 RepID=A0A2U3D6B2_SULT2|nr:nucleoid occlusion protein [Sulfoacidibacillus thermotolerans]PWI56815.1 nucleoid occlusion protein [Sulfoacidibacillus thermotolerans]
MKERWSRFLGAVERGHGSNSLLQQIPITSVRANRYQPRSVFDEGKLDELGATIRTHGMIQPIVVRPQDDGFFELVAGERRWRAAQRVGLDYIPAIVKDLSDSQAASLALIENLQREGLTAIEEALAYQKLIELHHLTQESLAQRLGKGQSTIANKLRLLNLAPEVQEAVKMRTISERHARALLSLSQEAQGKILAEILAKDLNVRQTEKRVEDYLAQPAQKPRAQRAGVSRDFRIAMNTVRESVKLIQNSGFTVQTEEHEDEEFFEFIIRLPKKKSS